MRAVVEGWNQCRTRVDFEGDTMKVYVARNCISDPARGMGEGFDCRCPNRNIKDIEGKSEPYEEVTIEIPTEARGSDWLGNGRSAIWRRW